jgi:hypothetical protein
MRPRTAALWTGGAAFGFGLFQFFHGWLDEDEVSGAAAAAVVAVGLLYAWWARCLQAAGRGEASALAGLLVLAAGWSLAGRGLGPLAACWPDCERHEWFLGAGNAFLGAAAAGASSWAIGREPSRMSARTGFVAAVLVVAALVLKAVTD